MVPPVYFHPYLKLLYSHLSKFGVNAYSLNFRSIRDFFKIFRWKRKNTCLIHFHWIENYLRSRFLISTLIKIFKCILQILFLKLIIRLKVVITLHNVIPHELFFPKIEHLAFSLVLKLSDSIIVHNCYAKKFAQKLYGLSPNKISVIPHGNFLNYYPNTLSSIEAREKLGIPLDKFVILFFGHIRPYKGIHLLLNAFKYALKRNRKLFLIIAGKPHNVEVIRELMDFIKAFPDHCMIKLGFILDNDVQIFMNAADIGVLPYKKITTSGSLLLFMSFGKPVIVSKLPPITEIASDDFAIFFDPNTPHSLENAILNAARKGDSLFLMGKRALEVAKLYDWKRIALMTFHVYACLLR